jgi:short-chain Z-isoprenyl diphosphate synthase
VVLRDLAYGLCARKLRRELSGVTLPAHVGLIMDGNRRWARQMGMASPSLGHKYGAEHVEDVLNWCERAGIRHVTVFLCSAENLQRRGEAEIALDMLPGTTAGALKEAAEATSECATGAHVTLAIGYGGRQEVLDAIRALLYEQADTGGTLTGLAETLTTDDIARHLYTAGQPDPDLVIRTSGEQRVSNGSYANEFQGQPGHGKGCEKDRQEPLSGAPEGDDLVLGGVEGLSAARVPSIANLPGVTSRLDWYLDCVVHFHRPGRLPSTTASYVPRRTSTPIALCVNFSAAGIC